MRRIGILTAGGDTPAMNATLYGAVERANDLKIEMLGITEGFCGILDTSVPHIRLNPLFTTIPELDPTKGGTVLGSSRTYVDPSQSEVLKKVTGRLGRLGIDGLVCIGGDGTLNGLQPISEFLPCVLAPKTIDNDLGLNYLDEPNEWILQPGTSDEPEYRKQPGRDDVDLEDLVNYVAPGYATAVYVVVQGIERIRTTAESHRRIAIIEVMGRQSGYIALGSAYGQPDIILIPEVPVNIGKLERRIRELFDLQRHVVIVVGEGVTDETGSQLGAVSSSADPAGNVRFSGAAEELKRILLGVLGDDLFRGHGGHQSAREGIFTRKVGHTQRGGRPISFDRFYAAQLGGKAVELLEQGKNNAVATLQWTRAKGITVDSISTNKLRDRSGAIHPRLVHRSFYDAARFQPSRVGTAYLQSIFTNAIGCDDVELIRTEMFDAGNLTTRYQSVNIDMQKRVLTCPGG